jgi:hypothetical protein
MKKILLLLMAVLCFAACKKNNPRGQVNTGKTITSFTLESGQIGNAVFNQNTNKITVTVLKGTDMSALKPVIEVSEKAIVSPASGETINVAASKKQQYTVTSESGEAEQWEVEFKVYDTFDIEYAVFGITSADGNQLQVAGDLLYSQKFRDEQKIELGEATNNMPLWQKWHLIYHSTANNVKYFKIRNLHSGKFLNVPANAVAGSKIEQFRDNDGDSELWIVNQLGDLGYTTIVNKGNGLALSVQSGNVVLVSLNADKEAQHWSLMPLPDQAYRDDAATHFFERNNPAQGSVAFDQGTSVPLSNGKVLWITQDAWDGSSFREGSKFPCNFFFSYNNSVMIQPDINDWDPEHTPNMTSPNHMSGRPKQIFANQPNTDWSWPGLGVQIGNDVWIQCGEGKGLEATNQSLYKLTPNSGNDWAAQRFEPAGMANQTNINYSVGMVKGGDGYVYSFGDKAVFFGYGKDIYVARFAESDPLKWTFWNGSAWVNAPTSAAGANITSGPGNNHISYVNGKYVMMSMDQGFNCDDHRDIYISTASSPTGPFTPMKYVYTINEYFKGKYTRYYTAAVHPEHVNGRNELLLTYSVNYSACGLNGCETGFLDPYYYRVKGIRVPYSIIGL